VTTKVAEPNTQAQQQLVNLQNQYRNHYNQWAQARTAQSKQQHLQQMQQTQAQMAQQQAQLVRYKDVTQDVKLRLAENVIIRVLNPEPEYDDKGAPVQFTKKDLERLKGKHTDLPGYHAEADALRNGLMVAVYVPKTTAAPQKKKKAADDDDDMVATDRQIVNIIIISNPVVAQQPNK